jgi:tetratricopeptide (TPR) repeat protein
MYKELNCRLSARRTLKYVLLALMLLCPGLYALNRGRPAESPVTVEGDFNEKLIQIALDNAGACYNSLNETYFQIEHKKPLRIYLSRTTAEARKLLEDHGHAVEAGDGFYVPSVPAVYTYIISDDTNQVTFEPLFASIAEHFMARSFDDAPEWFRSSLVTFLSKGAQIIDGKLVPAGPCPRAALALRAEVEADIRLNIKKLYVSSDERYREWPTGPYLADALLCWLNQTGHLADYVRMVRTTASPVEPKKRYELEVLEKATGASAGKINVDLKKYIENNFCTAAYLAEARDAQDPNQKETLLQAALKKNPDYAEAQLALARLDYSRGNYQLCKKTLTPLLAEPENVRFTAAARLTAAALYRQNNYAQARDYYQKVWDGNADYIYKYQIAYKIANCSHYLNEPQVAAQWYNQFLELDFQPDKHPAAVSYARKYVETFGLSAHERAD